MYTIVPILNASISSTLFVISNRDNYRNKFVELFLVYLSLFLFYRYMVCLVAPLLVTWIFSSLICVTLWRRRRKLKNKSKMRRSQMYTRAKHPNVLKDESDVIISEAEHVVSNENLNMEDGNEQPIYFENTVNFNKNRRRSSKILSGSVTLRVDLSLKTANGSTECRTVDNKDNRRRLLRPQSFTAKNILYRRSWQGGETSSVEPSNISDPGAPTKSLHVPDLTSVSLRQISREESVRSGSPKLIKKRPSNGSYSGSTKSSIRRGGNIRRKSSFSRARALFLTRTYEYNIAKTLLAVVLTFTVTSLPLIVVLASLQEGRGIPQRTINEEVTALVVSVVVLFSNSLWNCLIYGAKMPYFRQSFERFFNQRGSVKGGFRHQNETRLKCSRLRDATMTLCRKFCCFSKLGKDEVFIRNNMAVKR